MAAPSQIAVSVRAMLGFPGSFLLCCSAVGKEKNKNFVAILAES